jgi:SAM-dependent methyltransferase
MSYPALEPADCALLRCPLTGESLRLHTASLEPWLARASNPHYSPSQVDALLINASETVAWPVVQGVVLLLPVYALPLQGQDLPAMSRDKAQVFAYYNDLNYIQTEEAQALYADTGQWVDYRPVAADYIRRSFRRAGDYLTGTGRYYLDAASGPIGLPEYLALSAGYEVRVCVDLSFRALVQARANLKHQRGLFLCADLTNLPIASDSCDAVLSQHTLYHIPAAEQRAAALELYRVARPGARVAIVYNWFQHAWLIHLLLGPVQVYRLLRFAAARLYGRLRPERKRLYFHVHGPRWWRRLPVGGPVQFVCWRSLNKYALRLYAHEAFGGRQLLAWLMRLEDRYPHFLGRWGDYPLILIDKPAATGLSER